MENYRLRVCFPGASGTTYYKYIVRRDGAVSYYTAGEVREALSNLIECRGTTNPAEVRFMLEDVSSEVAARRLQDVLNKQWENNVGLSPQVELLR